MEHWDLIENPKNDTYKNLIKVLIENSDKFYFITRKELKYNQEVIAHFEPWVTETYKAKEWASTKTTGPAATVYLMESNEKTCDLLMEYATSLYDWVAPDLPEDLTFLKNDFAWFSCTTHEGFGGFSIRSDYYRQLLYKIPNLKVERTS